MFRHFSFNPASRHPSHLDIDSNAGYISTTLSPTSKPPQDIMMPPCSADSAVTNPLVDLQERFSNHHITDNSLPLSYFDCLRPSSPEAETPVAFSDSYDASATADNSRSFVYDRRLQRQRNSRLQCTPSHLSRLSALLEDMISQGEQCYCSYPPLASASSTYSEASSDAGDSESITQSEHARSRRCSESDLVPPSWPLLYRRSGDNRKSGTVVRSVRIRKRQRGEGRQSRNVR